MTRHWASSIAILVGVAVSTTTYAGRLDERHIKDDLKEAKSALASSDAAAMGSAVGDALSRENGVEAVRKYFAKTPGAAALYIASLEHQIAGLSSPREAFALLDRVEQLHDSRLLDDHFEELRESLTRAVVAGNENGSVDFDLSHYLERFPPLLAQDQYKIIVDRTIAHMQTPGGERPMVKLMEYVRKVGIDSAEGKRIEQLLPTLNVNRHELDTVGALFPAFVAPQREAMTVHVFLSVKGGDRLLLDDMKRILAERLKGVAWSPAEGPGVVTLVIDKLRHEERSIPESVQTVAYAQYQVNLAAAVLLMPRNATYLYELRSGGAEIEYGYAITATLDGKTVYDELVRGTARREFHRCESARIQNVFGGVQPAQFVANADMQSRCSGSGESVTIDDVRRDVFAAIAAGVTKVPPIERVQSLN